MTIENQTIATPEPKQVPFGTRLKDAREALGLEQKDAAAQLRLNEKIIVMMEKERYPIDLPPTFIRGYIRSYAKLLQIPEGEVQLAIEPIKQKPMSSDIPVIRPTVSISETSSVSSDNYFLQLIAYVIFFALLGGAGWYYTHNVMNNINTNSIDPAATQTSNSVTTNSSVPQSSGATEKTVTPASSAASPAAKQPVTQQATPASKPEDKNTVENSNDAMDDNDTTFSKQKATAKQNTDDENDAPPGNNQNNQDDNNNGTISQDAE